MEKKDNRRKFLIGVSGAVGGAAGLLTVAPFVSALRPSRKTQAASEPVSADVSSLAPGELRTVVWRRKLIWLFGRNQKMLDDADSKASVSVLVDPNSDSSLQPEYCKNKMRSIKPEVFVAVGLCTHLGCSPRAVESEGEFKFFCACHGSKFDVAGRVVKGSPAPKNLIIPSHYYANDNSVVVGEDGQTA